MKNTVIQCVTALICVIALAVTGMTCVGKIADASVEAAKKEAEAVKNSTVVVAPVNPTGNTTGDVTPADDPAAPADDPAAPADDPTAPADDPAAPADPAKPAEGSSVPSSPADILKVYNDAVNKAISSKAGYTKKRHTDLGQLEGAEAIMKISIARDAVYSFLGVGDNTYTNKKGEAKFLSAASLSAADVSSAKCTEAGGVYTITLTLKDGKSSANDSAKVDNSPLKRSGLLVGTDDKNEYDYKSAVNIYAGLKNSDDTDIQAVEETTSKTTITMKVDAKSGKISSLSAAWHWDASLTKVKYTFISVSGVGHADSSVAISGFQY